MIVITSQLLLVVALASNLAAEEYSEDDYGYDSSEEGPYYDGEHGSNSADDYNYSYSYNYEEEAELNIVPELITRPQRIVIKQGDTAELPCEANVM